MHAEWHRRQRWAERVHRKMNTFSVGRFSRVSICWQWIWGNDPLCLLKDGTTWSATVRRHTTKCHRSSWGSGNRFWRIKSGKRRKNWTGKWLHFESWPTYCTSAPVILFISHPFYFHQCPLFAHVVCIRGGVGRGAGRGQRRERRLVARKRAQSCHEWDRNRVPDAFQHRRSRRGIPSGNWDEVDAGQVHTYSIQDALTNIIVPIGSSF